MVLFDKIKAAFGSFRSAPKEVKPEAPAPILGEIAYADPRRLFPGGFFFPYNPSELVTRKGMGIFDKMLKDDQVKAAIAFKKSMMLSSGWEITPPEGMDNDAEPIRFATWCFKNFASVHEGVQNGTLDESLSEILSAMPYGFSVSEKIWYNVPYGEWAGRLCYYAIKTKRPHDFFFKTDKFGNLLPDGVIQQQPEGLKPLPRDKFAIMVWNPSFQNWYGTSDLEAAYRGWWAKENSYRWLAMFLERLGIPPIFGMYDARNYTPSQIDDLKKVFENLQASTFGLIPAPNGAESFNFAKLEVTAAADKVFIPAINMFNIDIARGILMPSLLGLTPENAVGSQARAEQIFDMLMMLISHDRARIEQYVNGQLLKPLLDVNYTLKEYPRFSFFPVKDDVKVELYKTWLEFVKLGACDAQEEDEAHVRDMLGMPEPGGKKKTLLPQSGPFGNDKEERGKKPNGEDKKEDPKNGPKGGSD